MRSRKSTLASADDGDNVWPSFADLTATIALILFVLVLLAYIQNLISGKNLDFLRKQLDDTALSLESSQAEINRAKDQLRLLEQDQAKTMAEIERGAQRLKLSEAMVDEQSRIIAESNRELGQLRAQLRGMALLRVGVLEKVKSAMARELASQRPGDAPLLHVADNGNIVISESLLFEFNSHRVKDEGKAVLDPLAAAFANLLADPQVRASVDVVLVQGHTDERGTTAYNRGLSAKRANAVLDYMFGSFPDLESAYGAYFAASAHSEFRPVDPNANETAYEKNRRIEISVVLRDTQIQAVIDEYLGGVDPRLQPKGARPPAPSVPATDSSENPTESGAAPPLPAPPR
ncbi:MAG: flagellar motor protein MotB [Myxococcales bacterium FL481]|nr:MAG: flagellar motor protein MotB [Myxococcales bacterium FL481]